MDLLLQQESAVEALEFEDRVQLLVQWMFVHPTG